MNILIIGGKGSIGRRYEAVLRHIGHDPVIYDVVDGAYHHEHRGMDGAIIASPTKTHIPWLRALQQWDKPVLCEKPMGWISEPIESAGPRHMGNNWMFIPDINREPKSNHIEYDYYHWGNESPQENMYQPILLGSEGSRLSMSSPVFMLHINGKPVSTETIQWTYVEMLKAWMAGDYDELVDMRTAIHFNSITSTKEVTHE